MHDTAPYRRVGTFTFGVVLVVTGLAMLAELFWPAFDPEWMVYLAPLLLILLGVETLLSARRGGRMKYDWVGMLLCCLIVCTALCLFTVSWLLVNCPQYISW